MASGRYNDQRFNARAFNSGPDVSVSVGVASVTVAGLAPTVSVSMESSTAGVVVTGLPATVTTTAPEPASGGISWSFPERPERRLRARGLAPSVGVSVEPSPASFSVRALPPTVEVIAIVDNAGDMDDLIEREDEEILLLLLD